jgi:hypothetical protein
MKDKKRKIWSAIVGILFQLINCGLFFINPLDKNLRAITFVFVTCVLVLSLIPYALKNRYVWGALFSVLWTIVFGILYFFVL